MSQPVLDMSKSQPLGASGSSPSGQNQSQGAAPTGVTLDMSKSTPLGVSGAAPTSNNTSGNGTGDRHWYDPSTLEDVGKGFVKGAASTLSGVDNLVSKIPVVGNFLTTPLVGNTTSEQARTHLAQEAQTHNTAQDVGYGGETLMEFMMGDEALKGLSTADKALAAGKTLKNIEKSPKLMQALKLGARELAAQSARAGVVQGVQTAIRTGDLGEGAKTGLESAAVTGVLGGAIGAAGNVAGKLGAAGKAAGELAETAANAPDKQTIAENIQGQLQNSKTALHARYEAGINDLTKRLGDNSVEVKDSPVSQKAQELLEKPDPDDHDLTKQAKELAGDKIDKDTRALLESYANGTKPLSEEDINAAKEASKPSGLVDAQGNQITPEKVEPQPQSAAPLTANDLIQQRQAIRAAASKYEPGDINARVLNRLLGGFDDTMDQIAEKSGDPKAVSDYQALRNDYRGKINIYDNPVIKNLMEGKPDDAAKAFIATKNASGLPQAGKTEFNVDQLHTVLGDTGFTQFRNSVFDNLMQNSSDVTKDSQGNVSGSKFNPAKFIGTWSKIADGTKGDLFGAGDPSVLPQNYVTSVVQDAKTAANAQKLVRAGVLGAGGVTAGAVGSALPPMLTGGLSTILAFIAGHEGAGGITKGRDLIDYVANHPKMWATLRSVGDLPNNAKAKVAAKVIPKVGQAAVNLANAQPNVQPSGNSRSSVYGAANAALSGTQ